MDLFTELVSPSKQHHIFRELAFSEDYEPARKIIEQLLNHFVIKEKKFVQQFQLKPSFHHRLWELYLYSYLSSKNEREIIIKSISPDICICENQFTYYIEATTLNIPEGSAESIDEVYLLKKYKKALKKKMEKKYWDLPEIRGKPLILAIHDYTLNESLGNTPFHLTNWLYPNKNQKTYLDFFDWSNASFISGILVSGQATVPKFNRMGILAGYGNNRIKGLRIRQKLKFLNNDEGKLTISQEPPEATELEDPSYIESWSEGIVFFHNPYALHPIYPPNLGDITHIRKLKNGQVMIHPTGQEVINSETWFFKAVDKI